MCIEEAGNWQFTKQKILCREVPTLELQVMNLQVKKYENDVEEW